MVEYSFDTSAVPQGPNSTPGIRWPLGTRYLSDDVLKCHFHQYCGVEGPGLVSVLSDKRPKPNSTMDREGYWWTLCPEHYDSFKHMPDWPNP